MQSTTVQYSQAVIGGHPLLHTLNIAYAYISNIQW